MKKKVNEKIKLINNKDIYGNPITVPNNKKLVHLHFRRFAGCPVCNLHIHSLFKNANKLVDANIQSVIVFNSTQERMLKHVVNLKDYVQAEFQPNFSLIADPTKQLYKDFGLADTWKSLMHPKIIKSAIKGMAVKSFATPETLKTELIVPADFLINKDGTIIALKYGTHADDQWSIDRLLALARS